MRHDFDAQLIRRVKKLPLIEVGKIGDEPPNTVFTIDQLDLALAYRQPKVGTALPIGDNEPDAPLRAVSVAGIVDQRGPAGFQKDRAGRPDFGPDAVQTDCKI